MRKDYRRLFPAAFLIAILMGAPDAPAAEEALPESLARVLVAAIEDGNAAAITAVARSMIDAYPDQETAIRAHLAGVGSEAAEAALAALSAPDDGAEPTTASEAPAPPEEAEAVPSAPFFGFSGWTGEFQVGGNLNTGNTEEKSLAVALALDREARRWTHHLNVNFDFTRTDGTTSKRRFLGNYELDYDMSPRDYAFGFVEYRDDRFSGYDYRVIGAVGYGRHVIDRSDLSWELEGGPGFRYNKVQDTGATDTELVGRLTSELEWHLSETATFLNRLGLLTGTNTTTFDTLTALDLQINSRLSGRLSFETFTDFDPPPTTKKTDTVTQGSLVYQF